MTVYLIEAKEQPLSPGRAGWFSYQTKTDMYGALVLCLKNAYSCCMNLKGQPINRLNDVLMKYVFAREDQKAVTFFPYQCRLRCGELRAARGFSVSGQGTRPQSSRRQGSAS